MKGEQRFLAGRHTPLEETARLFRILLEFIRGFRALQNIGPAATVFGSARYDEKHPYWRFGVEAGKALADAGFSVLTGGGPGLMAATSQGARQAGGKTIGCTILLPHEQAPNPFLDRKIHFYYFFIRKVMLVKYSSAFVFLPGGFGTLDELCEAVTLIQTRKIQNFPIILVGKDYWAPFLGFLQESLLRSGAIKASELDLIRVTDSGEEMIEMIRDTLGGLPREKRESPHEKRDAHPNP
jgi:uncharacterized protein (TIGR00730 family)